MPVRARRRNCTRNRSRRAAHLSAPPPACSARVDSKTVAREFYRPDAAAGLRPRPLNAIRVGEDHFASRPNAPLLSPPDASTLLKRIATGVLADSVAGTGDHPVRLRQIDLPKPPAPSGSFSRPTTRISHGGSPPEVLGSGRNRGRWKREEYAPFPPLSESVKSVTWRSATSFIWKMLRGSLIESNQMPIS